MTPERTSFAANPISAGQLAAIRMIAADRENRHLQLALGEKLLIVDGIIRECRELAAEGVVNRLRPGVERGIMLARRLVDAGGICRQLVVEAVEQDALAPGDQALDVGAAEIEVPDLRILQLVVPVPEPGQRRIHHHPLRRP